MADYIRGRKAVALDELAAEFGLRGAEAPRRVAELEASGAITGVMDDRGKVRHPPKLSFLQSSSSILCQAGGRRRSRPRRGRPCPSACRLLCLVPPMQYIFISTQEMEAVADFIKARGRVSIAELAARSERLIDLAPVQQQQPAAELVF